MAKASNKEPSCKLNKLLVCSKHSECKKCGWYPAEEKRRKKELRERGLSINAEGKAYFKVIPNE